MRERKFRVGSGLVGLDDRVGNSDNRAYSAQVQMNLPTRAELGKIEKLVSKCRDLITFVDGTTQARISKKVFH